MTIRDFDPETDLPTGPPSEEYEDLPQPEEREAAPPDGVEQDWTELHPNGSAELMGLSS